MNGEIIFLNCCKRLLYDVIVEKEKTKNLIGVHKLCQKIG